MKKYKFTALVLIGFMLMAGCGKTEEVPTVIVDSEESVITYTLESTEIDDVILTNRLSCFYNKDNDQEVSFDVTGRLVDKVYVREGDEVKKGDLLCELTYSSTSDEIERLKYQITRNEMLLEYSYTDEELDIQDKWLPAVSGYGNAEAIKEQVEDIKTNYARKRELLNDSLEFDRAKLNAKNRELNSSRLYAAMDGKVYKMENNLEGSTSKAGKVLMTIVGNGEGFFEVKDTTDKDLFHEGDVLDLRVSAAGAAGDYTVTPYDMENWTDSLKFSILSQPETAALEVGATAILTTVVESRKDVLTLPVSVVHIAKDTAFVYTLNENNDREIRYIEIGLIGDSKVEIISGLTEGEKVVKK